MAFKNRDDAARQLLPHLEKYKSQQVVVLVMPPDGMPIAYRIAKQLHFSIDLLLVKKIGHPLDKEFEIGIVSMDDLLTQDNPAIPVAYLNKESARIKEQLKEIYNKYTPDKDPVKLKGKTVILTHDWIVNYKLVISAVMLLRKKQPSSIAVVIPVCSRETAEKIKAVVDDFICLQVVDNVENPGAYYKDFPQVKEEEIITWLHELNEKGIT